MIRAKNHVYSELFEKYQSLIEDYQQVENRVELKKDLFRLEKEYRDLMASILCHHLNLENPLLNESIYYLSDGIYHELKNSSIELWN